MFKTLVIPCIHILRMVTVWGATLIFEHVTFFFIWGSMRSEGGKKSPECFLYFLAFQI